MAKKSEITPSDYKQEETEGKSSAFLKLFVINVDLYNTNDVKRAEIKIKAGSEAEAFAELPAEVKKIHNGKWNYANEFKIV